MAKKKTITAEKDKQKKQSTPETGASFDEFDNREHAETLRQPWTVLLGNPNAILPQVLGTLIHSGASRPSWTGSKGETETMLLVWPQDQPLRAGAVFETAMNSRDEDKEKLKPKTMTPFMEGYNNDFEVHSVAPWESGVEANVAVTVVPDQKPLWFYNPLYFRDKSDLTPGVTHTFLLSGLALGIRRALLDEMTITQGPIYEAHVESWLAEHPDKSRLDVPTLKVNLAGKHLIRPGRSFGEYEARGIVVEKNTCTLDKLEITMLRLDFPMPQREPLHIMLYVPAPLLKDYVPEVGHEIDTYMWLQGRILDVDGSAS